MSRLRRWKTGSVGKTIDEVMALSVTAEGTTDETDLTSSVTSMWATT